MRRVYITGADSPLQLFMAERLTGKGYVLTPDPEQAQILILFPLTPVNLQRQETYPTQNESDMTLDWIQTLPYQKASWGKLIFISSEAIYGQGEFLCGDCGHIDNYQRPPDIRRFRWDARCPYCEDLMIPQPVSEESHSKPQTLVGQQYLRYETALESIQTFLPYPIIRLRLFHPYWASPTFYESQEHGVMALMTQAILNETEIQLYEDANQMRDITHIDDIIQGIDKVIQHPTLDSQVFNLASGQSLTLHEMFAYLQEAFNKPHVPFHILEQHREGDIRHRIADIQRAKTILGYQPQFDLPSGMAQYARDLMTSLSQSPSILKG